MQIAIEQVSSKKSFNDFIYFPKTLYKNNELWTPPLWSEEKRTYDPRRNPVLRESDFTLFIARSGSQVLGRILVYVNHLFNAHNKTRTGIFGAFECVYDVNVAKALFAAAEAWLVSQDVEDILGPLHPVDEVWGVLVDGFEKPAVFLTPYNAPYYDALIKEAGFVKSRDLLAYEIDSRTKDFVISQRYKDFHEHFFKRQHDFSIRPINLKNLSQDAEHIWRISNVSLIHNWGFLPASYDILQDNLRRLKTIVDPDAIWFVEHKGRPIAFCLGYPDLNVIIRKIKGSLLPFGWLTLLSGIKSIKDYRLFGLAVDPHFHGYGLDALLYVHLTMALVPRHIRLEANWVLEENVKMNNSLRRLGMQECRRYRLYEKKLLRTF